MLVCQPALKESEDKVHKEVKSSLYVITDKQLKNYENCPLQPLTLLLIVYYPVFFHDSHVPGELRYQPLVFSIRLVH